MLVLTRKSQESVVVGEADNLQEVVRVTVIDVRGGTVKLGFKADNKVAIYREEIWERVRAEIETLKPNQIA
jgi:carbon storage regulator